MSDQQTPNLALPLVQSAQAQKHVTVNEALSRLDGLSNLVLESVTRTAPPATVVDGQVFGVPIGATNAWVGQEDKLAIAVNGGWSFVAPQVGMRGFVRDQGVMAIFGGPAGWVGGALSLSPSGSSLMTGMASGEVNITAGTQVVSTVMIPNGAMVIGATARVSTAITGTLASWRLGTSGAEDRFGAGLGLGAGSWARGMLSSPVTYWQPEMLMLSATGGDFAGGRVKLAVHWLELSLPL